MSYETRMMELILEAVPSRLRKGGLEPAQSLQRDLGIDSIAMLALLFRFEQEFAVDLATIDVGASLGQMRTVGDALEIGRQVIVRSGGTVEG